MDLNGDAIPSASAQAGEAPTTLPSLVPAASAVERAPSEGVSEMLLEGPQHPDPSSVVLAQPSSGFSENALFLAIAEQSTSSSGRRTRTSARFAEYMAGVEARRVEAR